MVVIHSNANTEGQRDNLKLAFRALRVASLPTVSDRWVLRRIAAQWSKTCLAPLD